MELLNRIEELEKELAELKSKVKEGPKFPEYGDIYWCIDAEGIVYVNTFEGIQADRNILEIGNVFKTAEEAEFAVEKLKIEAELREFSEPWDLEKTQYTFSFNWEDERFNIECPDYTQYANNYYFDSIDEVQQAIETVGEDRIKKYIFEVW